MRIGIPNEAPGTRVAATPVTVAALLKLGYDVAVEKGAGVLAALPDAAFEEAGATVVDAAEVWAADIVAVVGEPTPDQVSRLGAEQILIGFLHPRTGTDLVEALAARGVTALSMDMVPRISRAQSLDALSSMANISGYRAVIEAGHAFGRFFAGQVTAAGKVPPAKVFVIGTGVAGLAAIGTAGSLGAEVYATDVRPETAEQVESMGATFLAVAQDDQGVSSDGYAKATTAHYAQRAAELYAQQARTVDIIITTAAIPGRPSPKLITAEMVASMRAGSVIVDLAASGGGNCELTRPGESYVTDGGVHIVGYTDLASRLPGQASQLYGTNVVNLMKLLTPGKDGVAQLDFDDQVHRQMTVTRDGEVTFPPPPIEVSVASAPVGSVALAPPTPAPPPSQWARFKLVLMLVAAWLLLSLLLPGGFLSSILVFGLACVVGYYVIWGVQPALYTPLMSVSNAVSGITIVGAITQLTSDLLHVQILALVAIVLAGINCVGGFAITHRMLAMFQRS
ncbi:Re/Si-specific NAD(P)(+) transhydrogenase subunit alpha [Tessaracoccus sp. G1721]